MLRLFHAWLYSYFANDADIGILEEEKRHMKSGIWRFKHFIYSRAAENYERYDIKNGK